VAGLRQEHPATNGALLLGADASLDGVGGHLAPVVAAPASLAPAVDVVPSAAGDIRLLADGTSWTEAGTPGPRYAVNSPVRLLAAADGALMVASADGTIAGGASVASALPAGATVVDAALFPGSHSGLALDSTGSMHAFGGADAALAAMPSSWTLPGQPGGIALAGTAQAPAGIITDSSGDWQTFGSLLLLPDATFGGPVFDPTTGLPIR
jgi:hypothetical protein